MTASVAFLLSFVLTLEGCSYAISIKPRIGPDPDRDLKEGATRAEVEGLLGEPLATETLSDGNARAVYQYTARLRSYRTAEDMMLPGAIYSLGLTELVFMPIAYFRKTKITYQKTYVYTRDGTIVETSRECMQVHPAQTAADWCSRQKSGQEEAEQLAPGSEDRPAVPEPEP